MRRNLLIFNWRLPPSRLGAMKHFPVLHFLLLLLFISSCERTKLPVLPEVKALQLEVAEAGVTEAWLQVKIGVKEPGQQLRLYREGELVQQLSIDRDTVVYDSGLAPAHSYTYYAELWKAGSRLGKTNNIILTTIDTTSHDFEWEVITIPSPFGSGALYDVAIINENNIWAVGEIYSDSTQSWLPYNAVHWDGNKWELKRIPFIYQGSTFWGPIYAIFAYSSDDVWFGIGSIIHWNGNNFASIKVPDNIFPSRINKMWGTSSNNIYIVGNRGLIAYYGGQNWQRIDTRTELPIQDIWGAINSETGRPEILCVASDKYWNKGKKILRINDETVTEINTNDLSWSLSGIWFVPGRKYYAVGAGIYEKINIHTAEAWKDYPPGEVTSYYTHAIRGTALNDVVAVGAFGEIVHFNGANWKNYTAEIRRGKYLSVAMKDNLIVAVGTSGGNGIIAVGRR